jgi:hypothetical protein
MISKNQTFGYTIVAILVIFKILDFLEDNNIQEECEHFSLLNYQKLSYSKYRSIDVPNGK